MDLPRSPAGPSRAAPYRILVVDDDPDMRDYLRLCLTTCYGAGTVVLAAEDGLDALEQAHGQPLDLIITDLVMPRLDGYGLCHAVRADARLGTTPILVISGDERGPGASVEAGADDTLSKPFNIAGLRLHTEHLLAHLP